jgi:uncharacterized repeat protein (TIGR03803 family)
MRSIKMQMRFLCCLSLVALCTGATILQGASSAHPGLPRTHAPDALVDRPNARPEVVLYSFGPPPDGANSSSALIEDASGNLYGTTSFGGNSTGRGIVFRLTPSQQGYTEAILHSFSANSDGGNPNAGVIADSSGILYGTAYLGGPNSNGSVYDLTSSGSTYTETTLYAFQGGTDGMNPQGALIRNGAGDLFGTTIYGGGKGLGNVFELKRSGTTYTKRTLYSFKGGTDGALPRVKLLAGPSKTLFGTTLNGGTTGCAVSGYSGCGIVFELAPSGGRRYKETVIYRFQGGKDGANPYADLIADSSGVLYGTTGNGGGTGCGGPGCGVAYKLVPNASGYTESVIWRFRGGNDGQAPSAGLLAGANGALYGTTLFGGTTGNGTVFVLTPSGARYRHTVLHSFAGAPNDGANPTADLIFGAKGALFSTTYGGGTYGNGTVFKLIP